MAKSVKKEEPKVEAKVYVVARSFRDVKDFTIEHKEGDDVSHFEAARLAFLIEHGLVKSL